MWPPWKCDHTPLIMWSKTDLPMWPPTLAKILIESDHIFTFALHFFLECDHFSLCDHSSGFSKMWPLLTKSDHFFHKISRTYPWIACKSPCLTIFLLWPLLDRPKKWSHFQASTVIEALWITVIHLCEPYSVKHLRWHLSLCLFSLHSQRNFNPQEVQEKGSFLECFIATCPRRVPGYLNLALQYWQTLFRSSLWTCSTCCRR